jgi:hypothetical protein
MPTSSNKFEIDFRRRLVEAIKAAFPKRAHLAAMVEDELYESLDEITSNEPDYKIAIRTLVQWAKTEGKLCDLVIGAARQKPGNPTIKQFTTDNLINFLILDTGLEPSIENLLPTLVTRLKSIDNFEGAVLPACNQVLPDIEKNHPELGENLSDPELSDDIKWLTVLKLFLKVYSGQNSRGESYLIAFVQKLQELIRSPGLDQWMTDLPSALKPQASSMLGPSADETLRAEKLKSIDVVFVISVEYPETTANAQDGQFTVHAYLLFYPGKENQPFSIQPVSLSLPSEADSTKSGQSSPSTMSVLATIAEVKESLAEWVKHAEDLAFNKCCDLKTTYGLRDFHRICDPGIIGETFSLVDPR